MVLAVVVLAGACDRSAPAQAPPLASTTTSSPPADGCAGSEVDGAEVIRFSGEGACLPAATIVQYRCGPAEVPVLRLADERHPTSFLGGPFAVPVETVPANIRSVGRGAGTEVLVADPPEPTPSPTPSGSALPISMPVEPIRSEPLVYVRRDGVTERWLGMERRRGVADPPVLWLVGDSIMDGGRDVLTSSLADWTLTIDAEVGRPSSAGVALAAAAADQEADVVVVELGTNDSSPSDFRDHLVATLDLLREVPLVVWQTARGPEDHAAIGAVNEAIREVVPGYPNVAIADWEAFVPEEALMEDGIHPLDGFESLESDLLTPILAAWRGAVSGDGATSCAGRVLRASD